MIGATPLYTGGRRTAYMDTSQDPPPATDGFPGPLTPEKVRRARERTESVRERIRQRGVDLSQLPDPVEELITAREAGGYRDM